MSSKAAVSAPNLRPRGSNQVGMRQFNERVVLQAIRLHGSPSQAEIARLTHLTPQTVSMILDRLSNDNLILRLAPKRGRVGQPSVPITLDPDGAFAIGIKVGRRNLDALLVDFLGNVRSRLSVDYQFPDPDTIFDDINAMIASLRKCVQPRKRPRLCGIGVAAPLSLGGWHRLLGVDAHRTSKWRDVDFRARIFALKASRSLPVEFAKDTAAACVAELVAGRGRSVRSFLYVFVDTFIGGSLVLDGHSYVGKNGNAGAIGSMPLGVVQNGNNAPEQLLGIASLRNLEAMYADQRLAVDAWTDERALQQPWVPLTRIWLERASSAIAMALNGVACILDIEQIIIDGSFSRLLLAELLLGVESALKSYSWEGVMRPSVVGGTIGTDARALGGAWLPIHANFAPDRDLFLKVEP